MRVTASKSCSTPGVSRLTSCEARSVMMELPSCAARRMRSLVSRGISVWGSWWVISRSCHSCTAHAVLRTWSTASRKSIKMRWSIPPVRMACSSCSSSELVFFN